MINFSPIFFILLILQTSTGLIDPTPFAAFGVLGGLLFAVAIMCGLVWRLFNKQSEMFQNQQTHTQTQTRAMLDWVDVHRRETTTALGTVVDKVSLSHDTLASTLKTSINQLEHAYDRQSRKLDQVLMTGVVLNKVAEMKKRGDHLDDTVIEGVVRRVVDENRNNER